MGRASVRAQIASYLSPASVGHGLGTTYRARPKNVPAEAFQLGAGGGSGAVLVVHLTRDDEHPVTIGPETAAQKFNVHDVTVEVFFQSTKDDAMVAMDDHDALIDALMARLRADRTLGSTAYVPIWQAGRDEFGIQVDFAEPVLSNQILKIDGVIRFRAFEEVTG